jgi:hypothetical protein
LLFGSEKSAFCIEVFNVQRSEWTNILRHEPIGLLALIDISPDIISLHLTDLARTVSGGCLAGKALMIT